MSRYHTAYLLIKAAPRGVPAQTHKGLDAAGERAKWEMTQEYKGSDGGAYRDYHLNNNPRDGILTVELDMENGYRIRNVFVDESLQRKGTATLAYEMLNRESIKNTGKPLRSSEVGHARKSGPTSETPEAAALWESLVQKGEAERVGDHYQFIPPQVAPPKTGRVKADLAAKKCPNCHEDQPSDKRFCQYCGYAFMCPRCGDTVGPPLKFNVGTCPKHGQAHTAHLLIEADAALKPNYLDIGHDDNFILWQYDMSTGLKTVTQDELMAEHEFTGADEFHDIAKDTVARGRIDFDRSMGSVIFEDVPEKWQKKAIEALMAEAFPVRFVVFSDKSLSPQMSLSQYWQTLV